jgi:uncharacterized protein
MICLSYRGYWKSRGYPSERGINIDTQSALNWTLKVHSERLKTQYGAQPEPVLVLWGQSIGAGFATNLAVSLAENRQVELDAVVLETPFLSIRAMLETLYPQRWLPYKHLWPFLRNHLDNYANLGTIASRKNVDVPERPEILILEAGKDELVPAAHGDKLYQRCIETGLRIQKKVVRGAYHNEASARAEGKQTIVRTIEQVVALSLARTETEQKKDQKA